MVPKCLVTFAILLASIFGCEGRQLSIILSSNDRNVDAVAKEEEPPLGSHGRQLPECTDHNGIVTYKAKGGEAEITCRKLARKASRGKNVVKRCSRELVGMIEFESGSTVGDACPIACGRDCDGPEPATPTLKPTESPGTDNGGHGEWGNVFDMHLIPIHSMILPDGNLLSYGTDNNGNQGADLYYEVWDPHKGTGIKARELLEHYTNADIFCSSPNVDPSTGNIIILGGDLRDPVPGWGINTVLEFNYETYAVRHHPAGNMHHARWYGTSINLPNGDIFVIGGRAGDVSANLGSPFPEVWSPGSGFRSLAGAAVPAIAVDWWYPNTFVNSDGEIICFLPARRTNAEVYRIDVEGNGTVEEIGKRPFQSHNRSPSIMFRTDQVLLVDDDGWLWIADISGRIPLWTKRKDLGHSRTNGSFAILPDGRIAIVGGTSTPEDEGNNLDQAVYSIVIWDPTTNEVSVEPRQDLARLYHSTALILPDGSVVSQGGGAPGPLMNQNGQIYFPDYLFGKDQTEVDARPSILACPRNVVTDGSFVIAVDNASVVEKVTVTKPGASTHAHNCDARWLDLDFKVISDNKLQVFTEGKNTMIPGLWMLNTIDKYGVPSVASLLGVDMAPLAR